MNHNTHNIHHLSSVVAHTLAVAVGSNLVVGLVDSSLEVGLVDNSLEVDLVDKTLS